MATENKREEKKHFITKKPHKSAKKINAVIKDKQLEKKAWKRLTQKREGGPPTP